MIYIKGSTKKLSIHPQIFVTLVIVLFTACYWWQTRDLSKEALLFPRVMFLGILVCAISIFKESIKVETITEQDKDLVSDWELPSKKIMLFILGVIVSIWLFMNTVALISIVPCAMLLMYIAGVRNIKAMVSVSLGLAVFVYLFFEKWLGVNLPNMLG